MLTLPGLAALSWSLLLLFSSLFAPQWWEGTRPIRRISIPYGLALGLISLDLSGRFGLFVRGMTWTGDSYGSIPTAAGLG